MPATSAKILAVLSLLGVSHAPAVAQNLPGAEIKALVSGKRVYLSTPYGLEFPLRYAENGQVTGDATGFRLAAMFAPRETGKWWVEGEKLCQKWPSWYDGKTLCFTVRQTGKASISWTRDDGLSGTARIEG